MVRKCPKFSEKVIPRVVKNKIKVFEKSDANFERSIMFCTEGELQVNKNIFQSGHPPQGVRMKLARGESI